MAKIKAMNLISSMQAGGAQRLLTDYLRCFKDDQDIEFKLFVVEEPRNSQYDQIIQKENLNVEYLNCQQSRYRNYVLKKLENRFLISKCINKAIDEYNPDLIHTHITKIFKHALWPIMKNHVPYRFNTLHSDPSVYKGRDLLIARFGFYFANMIPVCITKTQVQKAKQRYGIKNYELLYNGIDMGAFQNARISKDKARKILGIPDHAFVIGTVGRLNVIKNYSLLIRAFARVLEQRSEALLVFAGDGPDGISLTKLTESLGIAERVIFLGNRSDIVNVYSAIDVFALTSRFESCSLATLEAQALGLRCVISFGIPIETIATCCVKRMNSEATIEEWANALMDDNCCSEVVRPLEKYDVHIAVLELKNMYLRYCRKD